MASYLYVKGYNSETTLVDLIIYFQSKESRGGDIDDEECKFEKDEAILAFDEEEGRILLNSQCSNNKQRNCKALIMP